MIRNQGISRIGRQRGGRLAHHGRAAGILAAAVVACALPASASAGDPPPANDNWSGRIALSSPSDTEDATNVDAGREGANEPDLGLIGDHDASVWYSYTASADGLVTVDTCSSNSVFDSVIGVFSGAGPVETLTLLDSDDEGCNLGHEGQPSSVSFEATNGVTYSIMVASWIHNPGDTPDTSSFILTIGPDDAEPTNNDLAGAAELLESFENEFIVFSDNFNADMEAGEPNHAGVAGGASVWYRWTAPSNTTAVAIACSEDVDTAIGVYTGDAYPLTEVASNDDFPEDICFGNGTDSLTPEFSVTAGEEYKLAVDAAGAEEGTFIAGFLIAPTSACDVAPDNDPFDVPEALTGSSDTATGSNCGASKEVGEPDHAANPGGQSVWYSWTAPANGTATVDLAGSSFDTLLGVYTGGAVGALTEVASNDDEEAGAYIFTSKVSFVVTPGTVYRIAVDGYKNTEGAVSEGDIELALSLVTDQQPPPPPGGGTVDQAACDAANDALATAKAKLKKAKKRLKKAKASGDDDAIKKAKKAVKRAKKRVAAAQAAVEAACGTGAAKVVPSAAVRVIDHPRMRR